MNNLVIETQNLRKMYGNKVAVEDLTLEVPRGEVFGFLGPNGAGKSTSVKMLLGLVAATSGDAKLLGSPVGNAATMARVGFLPEHFRFPEWLQAHELLDLYGKLYHLDTATRRQRIPELLEKVGLAEHANRPIAGFSKGMLQRIGLAQAMINTPEIIFLDEPTSALDPFGRILVREIIHDLKQQGTTVFLNSHLLGEVEATCDRVSFIKHGKVLRTIILDDFREEHIIVEIRVDAVTPALIQHMQELDLSPQHMPHDEHTTAQEGRHREKATIEVTLPDEQLLPALAERILASGAKLFALIPKHVSLEEIFLEIIGNEDSGQ